MSMRNLVDLVIYGDYVISVTPAWKIHGGRPASRYIMARRVDNNKTCKRKVCFKHGDNMFYFRALLKMKQLIDNNKIQEQDANNYSTTGDKSSIDDAAEHVEKI